MKNFPISVGKIEKKLILIILLALTHILYYVFKNLVPKGNDISTINGIAGSLSLMLAKIFPCIFKYQSKSRKSEKNCTIINIKHYSILFLIIASVKGAGKFENRLELKVLAVTNIWLGLCFKMIFYIIYSIIILKSKYYIHNIISVILFSVFTIIIDYIFEYLNYLELSSFISLLPHILDDLLSVYMKYMIDKKYHSYWNILFFMGLDCLIIYSIEFIINIKTDSNNNILEAIENAETIYIIINFFLDIIFNNYLRLLLTMLILDYFSLNHVLISQAMYFIVVYFIYCVSDFDNYGRYLIFLIPSFFQIVSLLFFIEILEFNFCNLNKNTKRNIMLREETEMLLRNARNCTLSSDIEVDDGLILNVPPKEKNSMELYDLIIGNESN